jgi:hypothetical protein
VSTAGRVKFLTLALVAGSLALPAQARRPRPQPPPKASRADNDLLVTAALDRVKLPYAPKKLSVDALGRRVRLTVGPAAPAFAAQFRDGLSRACPKAVVEGPDVVLECSTSRLAARVDAERGEVILSVRQVRGVPWRGDDDGPPAFRAPEVKACPDATPMGLAECSFQAGQWEQAERLMRGLTGEPGTAAFAHLRLGDIAAARDELVEAVAFWNRTGTSGPVFRLARARLCELSGDCFGKAVEGNVFDDGGLPEPWRRELELRRLRQLAFRGQTAELGALAARRARVTNRPPLCVDTPGLCLKLIGNAMRDPAGPGADEALEFYMTVPGRESGPRAYEWAGFAASICERNGAPSFGANILASTTATVPPALLAAHLERTLRLFVEGKDYARARLIAAYVQVKLPKARLKGPPWAELISAADGPEPEEAPDAGVKAVDGGAGGAGPGGVDGGAGPEDKAKAIADLLGPGRASVEDEIRAALAAANKAKAGTKAQPQPPADAGSP